MNICECGCGRETATRFLKGHNGRAARTYSPDGAVTAKTCYGCGEMKPIGEYYAHPGMDDGRLGACKECRRKYQRDKNERLRGDPEFQAARARYSRKRKLRDAYGITEAEYDAMLADQGGKCAICGTTDPGRTSTFFPVDHDHETGGRRGLLCHDCNLGISHFGDDPDRLLAAAMYLLAGHDVLGVVF